MADERENLNLQLETSEFMDQPSSEQHDHVVVTIPPAPDDSSIASSSSATGSQTLNLPTIVPREDDLTDESTSTVSWLTFDFYSTSIQIILLVVFLSVFRHEHPHVALRVWIYGYGVGCLAMLLLLYCDYKHSKEQSNLLPQAISTVSPGSEVDESQTSRHQRFGKILKWLWRTLNGFFALWFFFGLGIVAKLSALGQTPHLGWLCTMFLIISVYRLILPYIVMQCYAVFRRARTNLRERPRRASVNVISTLPTYKFCAHEANQANKDNNNMRVSIKGDEQVGAPATEVIECCICLDPYEDGVEVKELPCRHHFHVKCIDQWLKINGACPTCKRKVGTSSRASATELSFTTVAV